MRKIILLCASLFAMVLSISLSPAMAQAWVGPNGSDANACTEAAPCATFQGALDKGNISQINCLGSGSYATVLITASLTIDCGAGNVGNIVGSSGSGIVIITSSAATIVLRHLALNGLSTGTPIQGIVTNSFFSGTLIVEDCMIQGYAGAGINFQPQSGRGLLEVSDSEIFGNQSGIVAQPASGQIASVTLDHVKLTGNTQNGLVLGGAGVVAGTMRNSVAGSNTSDGVLANAGQVFFTVEESSIVNNLVDGIQTNSAGSVVNVGASTIGGNGTGVKATSGSLISFGDNHMSANGSNGNFTSTTALR